LHLQECKYIQTFGGKKLWFQQPALPLPQAEWPWGRTDSGQAQSGEKRGKVGRRNRRSGRIWGGGCFSRVLDISPRTKGILHSTRGIVAVFKIRTTNSLIHPTPPPNAIGEGIELGLALAHCFVKNIVRRRLNRHRLGTLFDHHQT